ncbi:hypothetical protein [Corallococcus macrosporus]|uniref:Uncharacterized protein n=1 Tax=Corallococcus macrosporus DSM 14697 TaxID=1189310 RepID=A0A250K3T3_9BACT|nr:hypothetical protein [Corallococcus macrosporus]ATB50754.1 hypothetical protein MYMAC_006410 [Corallococcus macrosporus DSM 14697]
MKFLCDACERLVPLQTFRTEAGGLVVTCGRCGADSRVGPPSAAPRADVGAGMAPAFEPVSAPPAVPAPMPLPGDSGEPVARAATPALRVVRLDAGPPAAPLTDEALFEPPPGVCPKCVGPRREEALSCAQCGLVYVNYLPGEPPLSDVLADAWRKLAARWEDWDAHDRLMTLAVGRGELAMVGRLYRVRLARAPGDTVAQRGRDEVVRRATLGVPSSLEPVGAHGPLDRMKKVALGVGFIVVLVLAVLVFQHLRSLSAGY